MKPRRGENAPFMSSSRSHNCRCDKVTDIKPGDSFFSRARRRSSTRRLIRVPPYGLTRLSVTALIFLDTDGLNEVLQDTVAGLDQVIHSRQSDSAAIAPMHGPGHDQTTYPVGHHIPRTGVTARDKRLVKFIRQTVSRDKDGENKHPFSGSNLGRN